MFMKTITCTVCGTGFVISGMASASRIAKKQCLRCYIDQKGSKPTEDEEKQIFVEAESALPKPKIKTPTLMTKEEFVQRYVLNQANVPVQWKGLDLAKQALEAYDLIHSTCNS